MSTYTILIVLSGLVIFSYLFDLFASKTKLPSVLLLLLLGISLRLLSDHFHWPTVNLLRILPTLGTIGLILIVFEGALELKYDQQKNAVIKGALSSAVFILLACVVAITFLLHQITTGTWKQCFINAIPFSIISSAIAIPSVANLNQKTKEFIIYESSFSDILGVILFNFAVSNPQIALSSFAGLGLNMLLISILSILACVLLLYLMGRISHHIKFFLIISILIMVYAIGQSYHLSALVLILAFGLFLNNADQIKYAWFSTTFLYKNLANDLSQLHQLSAESAFIIRTFFFVIFGFTINIHSLDDQYVFVNGIFIVLIIYAIRFSYLYFFKRQNLLPEGFVSPRGLISILLYYNLPPHLKIPEIGTSFIFIAVLGTSVLMTIGLLTTRKTEPAVIKE